MNFNSDGYLYFFPLFLAEPSALNTKLQIDIAHFLMDCFSHTDRNGSLVLTQYGFLLTICILKISLELESNFWLDEGKLTKSIICDLSFHMTRTDHNQEAALIVHLKYERIWQRSNHNKRGLSLKMFIVEIHINIE